eukprot:6201338-Prymnesium_polylepis.1
MQPLVDGRRRRADAAAEPPQAIVDRFKLVLVATAVQPRRPSSTVKFEASNSSAAVSMQPATLASPRKSNVVDRSYDGETESVQREERHEPLLTLAYVGKRMAVTLCFAFACGGYDGAR